MPVKRSKTSITELISTILVPTDFSKGADQALERALTLPLRDGAVVHLLHVKAKSLIDSEQRAVQAVAMKDAVAHARLLVKELGLNVLIASKVVTGRSYEEIVRQSHKLGAELIVMGRHGHQPLRDMFMGSTADRIIRYGTLPVLLVNGPAHQAYGHPIAAVDFGETTGQTLRALLRVVGPAVAEVALVHAYHVPFEGLTSPSPSTEETSYRMFAREQAVQKSTAALASLPQWGVSWRTFFVNGDARGAALSEAQTQQADLIALGTHARSGLSHVLLGSVAEWIAAAAHCDVLIVRPTRFTFQPLT